MLLEWSVSIYGYPRCCHNKKVLTYSILDSKDWTESLSKEWEDLFLSSDTSTPFQAFEWASTWWFWFGKFKKPHIFVAREGKDIIGLMPMYETFFPLRLLKPMGDGRSDYLHPLIRKGYEGEFAECFAGYLKSLKGFDLIDLQQLRESNTLCEHFTDCKVVEQDACYLLELPSQFDTYLKMLSKSMRYEARRTLRPPFTNQEAQIRTIQDPDSVSKALEIFFSLHLKRWKSRALPGSFAMPITRKFHLDYAKKACAKGRLRLSILEYKNKPIGAFYGMKAADRYFFYQSGFDPAFQSISPGNVLVSHTIQLAISEGATHFDFMRGIEPYKARWKPQKVIRNVRILKASPELKGKLSAFLKTSATKTKLKWTLKSAHQTLRS